MCDEEGAALSRCTAEGDGGGVGGLNCCCVVLADTNPALPHTSHVLTLLNSPLASSSLFRACVQVTRTRLDLESIVFQSCVSPKVAVRMLYAIVIALAHRFKKLQTRHMRLVDTVFRCGGGDT